MAPRTASTLTEHERLHRPLWRSHRPKWRPRSPMWRSRSPPWRHHRVRTIMNQRGTTRTRRQVTLAQVLKGGRKRLTVKKAMKTMSPAREICFAS
uniref:Uncharacterized protein n=1 Tax=Oryza punctata TaxID=4537 RepID=A0A0E0KN09_ORYPU